MKPECAGLLKLFHLTRIDVIVIAAIVGVPTCAWIASEVRWARLNAPEGKFSTLREFLNSPRPPERLARIQTDAGTYYIGYGSMNGAWLAVPSGPPAYVFDQTGALVYYSTAIGDDSRFHERWPGKSQQELSTEESQTMKLGPEAATEWPAAANMMLAGTDSPSGFTLLLQRRWPLESIRAFCIPERRHNPSYQLLVPMPPSPVWEGTLHGGQATGFDRIWWYASVTNGQIYKFSLNAENGTNFWSLEGGMIEKINEPPVVTPDPSTAWFIGHK